MFRTSNLRLCNDLLITTAVLPSLRIKMAVTCFCGSTFAGVETLEAHAQQCGHSYQCSGCHGFYKSLTSSEHAQHRIRLLMLMFSTQPSIIRPPKRTVQGLTSRLCLNSSKLLPPPALLPPPRLRSNANAHSAQTRSHSRTPEL